MKILVTGGAGYIGSHTAVELLDAGHEVVVVDNLSNSSHEAIKRINQITGREVVFYELDVCDKQKLDEVFRVHSFDAVIHFAGLKAVGESVEKPLKYYRNNVDSTLSLCEVMLEHKVNNIVFSSSATVYGADAEVPYKETSVAGVNITNPYGQTKYMVEQILRDTVAANPEWQATLLRYFNPIGAHESGLIGEDPNGIPNNLLPYVSQVAAGKLAQVNVFGDDYETPDGTGVRDYIHVVDLARGHLAALEHSKKGVAAYNLGTGKGASVLEVVKAFEAASGKSIPYQVVARRPGDLASYYADCSKAEKELGWKSKLSLKDACTDSWRWQSKNPEGYDG